jgi:nicotinamide phosphoribosyltransferase
MNKANSFILMTDAYKLTHWKQYPKGAQVVYSYFESRGGAFHETVFYGLQILLNKYFKGQVFNEKDIEYAREFSKGLFGTDDYFNINGWTRLLEKHGGRLPISIKAVPEGTVMPYHNVLITVENTDEEFPWLTNFIETILVQLWYPITVASMGLQTRRIIQKYVDIGGGSVSPFHLNDFGFRGVSSRESAGIGGSAHLVNFWGTDNLEGIEYAKHYYKAKNGVGMSVFATEHSTTTINGSEHEIETYEHFIDQCPNGILSVVSDSYDVFYTVKEIYGSILKDKILARDGKFVVRPDSGNPEEMAIMILESLWDSFGGKMNEKGFRVLNPKVGVIYGDGINYHSIDKILHEMTKYHYSVDNIVFGEGGGLLQQIDRDTNRFAFKCSAAKVKNHWRDVFKDPVTDTGKRSKKGRLKLIHEDGHFKTVGEHEPGEDKLVEVFRDGEILVHHTFDEIRDRVTTSV